MLVLAGLEGRDEIARVELVVAVPVSVGPVRIADYGVFVVADLEDLYEVGPGLLESAYKACLVYKLKKRGFQVDEEVPVLPVPVVYDEVKLECGFRADMIVNGIVVVELKAKAAIHPAQTLSHLRLLGLRIGLMINFHEVRLVDGVHRIVNGYRAFETQRHRGHRVSRDEIAA